jgi:hypothetical protein
MKSLNWHKQGSVPLLFANVRRLFGPKNKSAEDKPESFVTYFPPNIMKVNAIINAININTIAQPTFSV